MNRRLAPLLGAAVTAVVVAAWPRAAVAAEDGFTIFPDPLWLVALIALFLVLVWPLDRLLFRPMLRVLDERRMRIQGARERAALVSKDAEEVFGRYQRAVDQARAQAEQTRRETLDGARRDQSQVTQEAREEAEEQMARARREVAEALEEARARMREQAEDLAREAASRLLGRSIGA